MNVGVLALQGDWAAHCRVLREMEVTAAPVRTAAELASVDAIIAPGGESTAMLRLMEPEGLLERLAERIAHGMPTLAICAGLILLARTVDPVQRSLDVLDVDVSRNAYGRQVHSTIATIEVNGVLGEPGEMEAVFIRAPRITRVGSDVEVLGRLGKEPVAVRSGRVIGATFHPELTPDRRLHQMFCDTAEVSGA
jgi:5'-phosphate synthase pdxT subunit